MLHEGNVCMVSVLLFTEGVVELIFSNCNAGTYQSFPDCTAGQFLEFYRGAGEVVLKFCGVTWGGYISAMPQNSLLSITANTFGQSIYIHNNVFNSLLA